MMISLAHMLNERVRVNPVLIGADITDGYATAGITPEVQERMMHPDTLIGHPGRPQDIADARLRLCSPAGGRVSGQTIDVHGGGNMVRLFAKGGRARRGGPP